jgi:hypothetical protein
MRDNSYMTELLFAYNDESGNTGNNISDNAQPYFWTGTLLSRVDLEEAGTSAIQKWTSIVETAELHGNELGLGRIEKIAEGVLEFLEEQGCRFVFTRVEKRHVASMKLADTLLDSGLNKAVSALHYGNRALRLPLAQAIAECLEEQSQLGFWSVYENGDAKGFCSILQNLKQNIENKIGDQRIRDLLVDTIEWSIEYPELLLEMRRSEMDSPNMVAFALLINSIHKLLEGTEIRVGKFIHDEQNQFAKSMHEMYDGLRRIQQSVEPTAWITDIKEVDTYMAPLEFMESRSLVGLQLIDVILWLTKRRVEGSWPLWGLVRSEALLGLIFHRAVISEFSRAQLAYSIAQAQEALYSRPFSPEDEVRAREILQTFEEKRKSEIAGLRKKL